VACCTAPSAAACFPVSPLVAKFFESTWRGPWRLLRRVLHHAQCNIPGFRIAKNTNFLEIFLQLCEACRIRSKPNITANTSLHTFSFACRVVPELISWIRVLCWSEQIHSKFPPFIFVYNPPRNPSLDLSPFPF
jgi:hypothetical protein